MSSSLTPSGPVNPKSPLSPGQKLAPRLQNGGLPQMDGRQSDYQQQGSNAHNQDTMGTETDSPPAEHPAAQQYPQGQDHRAPQSFDNLPPQSARSGSFPEYIQPQRQQQYPQGQGPPSGGLAQPASPSMPLSNSAANSHTPDNMKSNQDMPIDPSIAASPTYPAHPPYSPYSPEQMQHYAGAPGVYARPEWAHGHYQAGPPIPHYGQPHSSGPPSAGLVSPVHRPPGAHPLSTVYSFVPIPGAQQHKRPRRRYEEIERMYKCGWQGCEKAYGTLNHLNAHVTMQSHGAKRTPEEFKEIRKEWKQKKKEEEQLRKSEEDRQRQAQEGRPGEGSYHHPPSNSGHIRTSAGPQVGGSGHQLPPIAYAANHSAAGYGAPSPALVDGSIAPSYPSSPYPPTTNNIYPQRQNGQNYHN
ncbi:hypothetical protein BT63DRAFT_451202 [Microthyrium microscopicum]|uniref:C2H2-type domain-containing protein n=1 Tax=Microthyrium microscopicum TaxID=703497 RepID=A0A6A6UN12_9PEZI|nr:hypothetical protein BT63DRAFT_451202 [Microthyrium microscopicum]